MSTITSPDRRQKDERLYVRLPADEKRAVFEASAKLSVPVSELIRRGIVLAAAAAAKP